MASATIRTRRQTDMAMAIKDVSEAAGEACGTDYKTLCNKLPVMIRTCGLCQTLAFVSAKAGSSDAYRLLEEHLKKVLGVKGPDEIARLSVGDYMHATRRALAAWVYYKRFATALIKEK